MRLLDYDDLVHSAYCVAQRGFKKVGQFLKDAWANGKPIHGMKAVTLA